MEAPGIKGASYNIESNTPINVLLIGNNPSELGYLYDRLKDFRGAKILIDTAFSLKDSINKVINFKPNCILIDDNLNNQEIQKLVEHVNSEESTSHISIALIKNSNYKAIVTSGIQEFLLKTEATAERLGRMIINAIYLKKTRSYLFLKYRKNRRLMYRLITKVKKNFTK